MSRRFTMDRRNFFRAGAASLIAPMMARIFDPLRAYAQDSPKGDQLIITKVEPYLIRLGAPGGGGGGGEGGGRGFPCARIETAEGIHGWGEGTTPPTSPA